MEKIATHDSATGEKSSGLLSMLFVPFARTQSKTIKEQYEFGCRMFDIRVRRGRFHKKWICAHGIWESKLTIYDILNYLNKFNDTYVTITYEGKKSNDFMDLVNYIEKTYTNIVFGGVAYKYGDDDNITKVSYKYIKPYPKYWPVSISKFLKLDGRSWHTYLPIPWLWKKIYYNNPKFNNDCYTYVDFL